MYTAANDPTTLAGFAQGTGTSSSGSYASSDLKDYNLEGLGVNAGSLASSYTAKTSLNGTITYSGGTTTTFTSSYDTAYANTPASLATIAGTYAGTVAVPVVGNQTFSLAVSSAGAITSTGNGCTVTGTIAPRTVGNAYDVTMSFAGASCSLAGNSYAGVADYSATSTSLVFLAPNTARSSALMFIGALSTPGGGGGTSTTPITLDVSTGGTAALGASNRYSVAVTPGTQYVASLTGIVGNANLSVYTDSTYSTLATCAAANIGLLGTAPEDCAVTPNANTLYLAVAGVAAVSNTYRVRVSPKNNAPALSEGTVDNPVTLNPNVVYQGAIGAPSSAYSYYKVSAASGATISINMTGLQGTQSLDMRVYNASTGAYQSCTNGLNGLLPEECQLPGGIPYTITIINYAAGVGGAFTLMVDSPNDPAGGITAGTTSALTMNASSWSTVNGGVLNKYSVPVTAGVPYVASLYGITGDVDLRVYTDSTYTTLASCTAANTNAVKTGLEDCIVTPTATTLYVGAYGFGAGTNNYRIRVAPQNTGAAVNQGTSAVPIVLTPGTSYAGSIAPPASSYSYYRVTTTGTANTSINLTGMSGAQNLDMRVYAVPGGAYQSCNNGRTGVLPEECILPSGTWDITVINYGAGVGGTFLMTAD
jgi:hypothetical protein